MLKLRTELLFKQINIYNMRLFKLLAIGIVGLSLTSCVSKKQFDALNLNYKQCIEDAGDRMRQIQDLKGENSSLKGQNDLLVGQNNALKSSLDA